MGISSLFQKLKLQWGEYYRGRLVPKCWHVFFMKLNVGSNANSEYNELHQNQIQLCTVADLAILFFKEWEPAADKSDPLKLSASIFRGHSALE